MLLDSGCRDLLLRADAEADRGTGHVRRSVALARIRAYVKPDNAASARAFARAGFRDHGATSVGGHEARLFVLEREHAA